MAFTSYVVDNDRKFRDGLNRASQVSQDLRVPFGLILSDFYKSEAAIFKLKGPGLYPPFSGPKDPVTGLTKYQAAKKKKVGFDYPLLVRSGLLSNSLLGPNNTGSISKITPLSLTFGTSVKYGIYHQSDDPRSKIPLRKFLFIGPEAPRFANSEQQGRLERWLNIMNDFVVKQLKKAAA